MQPQDVSTLAGPVTVEPPRVKGSRFVGDAAHATDETSALAFIDTIRAREPSATHHCWAFALTDGRQRSSDDGEPGGTAGAPILQRILGHDLQDVVVVVTRYYGGTNLGRGGLVRAYGGCAAAALAAAPIRRRPVLTSMRVAHPYDLTGPVDAVLALHDAVEQDASFGLDVQRVVGVRAAAVERFVADMVERTAGQVVPTPDTTPPSDA